MTDFAFKSVKGKREKNEDYYGNVDEEFFLVADGLGGHPKGEVASKLAVEAALDFYKSSDIKDVSKRAKEAFKKANERIKKNKKRKLSDWLGMGTTLVGVILRQKRAIFVNVGDSRGFIFRDGKLTAATKVDRTIYGRLNRALGIRKKVRVHIDEYELKQKDMILLCSDGLTDFVSGEEIEEVLKTKGKLDKKAEELIALAMDNDSNDNVTVCLVKN